MTDRGRFLRMIIADPYNKSGVRGVFADWLDDRGESILVSYYRQLLPWDRSGLEVLRGLTVNELSVCVEQLGGRHTILSFKTKEGNFDYKVIGDCCSESWLYSVDGADKLIGHVVVDIVEVNTDWVNVYDGLGMQAEDKVYGIGLLTDAGLCRIVYRNSSNGYYGGWIEPVSAGKEYKYILNLRTSEWNCNYMEL